MLAEQAEAFKKASFSIATASLEDFSERRVKFYPALTKGETVLYRGWMLSPSDYQLLTEAIVQAGAKPFTTLEDYLLSHHIPNWYEKLSDLTPETVCFTNLETIEQELAKLNWQSFFVKDFVKSLKTSVGSRIESAEQVCTVITEMEKFRGQIEGGICVRQIEAIDDESEQRYFVIKGKAFSAYDKPIPEIVLEAASRIQSDFFSVDIAMRNDGNLRIIEIGDGQVSDIVGWSPERFVELWSGVS